MASKHDRFYFENLAEASSYSLKAAEYLYDYMSSYNVTDMERALNEMHAIEHEGDTKKHEMTAALAKAFVTPLEREDIAHISQNIDEVTDSIEEVLQTLFMYNIKAVTPESVEFAGKLVECCRQTELMFHEFSNFKKPQKLHELIFAVGAIEEECDRLYMDAVHRLNTHFDNAMDILSWREIYKQLENCADSCEHVCDSVELIVMKNT